jgi:gamma-glutamylcyclotransferase (GGCT)/AIG2-like uncharacterized protein YtfP
MLYFAYGMNTNPQQMAMRCPGAVSYGHARLVDHRFRFATHADVEACEGSYVDGVLWEINEDHLRSLDALEGFPDYYTRKVSAVVHGARTYRALVYCMQPGIDDSAPGRSYYNMVLEGYRANNVPTEQLENSVYI